MTSIIIIIIIIRSINLDRLSRHFFAIRAAHNHSVQKSELPKMTTKKKRQQEIDLLKKEMMYDLAKIENSGKAACRVCLTNKDGGTEASGSGVLIDGSSLLYKSFNLLPRRACLLTNHHVIGTKKQAKSSFIYFNYEEHAVSTKWLKAELDPSDYFEANKELDVCIVPLNTANIPRLSYHLPSGEYRGPRTLQHVANDDEKPHCPAPIRLDREAALLIEKNMITTIWQHPGKFFFKKGVTWKLRSKTTSELSYMHHTETGASGGPIYNSTADLIGIHCAGGTLSKPSTLSKPKTINPKP